MEGGKFSPFSLFWLGYFLLHDIKRCWPWRLFMVFDYGPTDWIVYEFQGLWIVPLTCKKDCSFFADLKGLASIKSH